MGRVTKGVTGDVVVMNTEYSLGTVVNMSFIPQTNYLIKTLTVMETLMIASRLKNPKLSSDGHENLIQGIIKELLLDSCIHLRVNKISGGQTKRLSIAVELVSRPTFIALDEPTSGLDSFTSHSCVALLREITRTDGPAIIASIHQPNFKIFNMFDFVYVLSLTGSCIYHGPPLELNNHLMAVGLNCPQFCNPSDYVMDVSQGDEGTDVLVQSEELTSQLSNSMLPDEIEIKKYKSLKDTLESSKVSKPKFKHWWILWKRSLLIMYREPMVFWAKMGQSIFIALSMSFLWGYKIGEDDLCMDHPNNSSNGGDFEKNFADKMQHLKDNSIFIYTIIEFVVIASATSSVLTFPFEMQVVMKETFNNWYDSGTYYSAKSMASAPVEIAYSTVFGLICYTLSGQKMELFRMAYAIANLAMLALTAESMATIFGIWLYRDPMSAVFMSPSTVLPLMLFGGYLVKYDQMPVYLKPFSILSYSRYGFYNMMITIYGFGRCPSGDLSYNMTDSCADSIIHNSKFNISEISKVLGPLADIDVSCLNRSLSSFVDFMTPKDMTYSQSNSYALSFFEVDESNFYINFLYIKIFLIVFKIISYGILYVRTSKSGDRM